MQKLLTIVVPVYKVEPYINKCLDSCVLGDKKMMSLLEVIIVNDGTPDNSAEMSREYVKRYPQTFRQIDKRNGGHGSAWNVGLKEATGKYLRFLASDDWLSNLDKLMYELETVDADLIFTHRIDVYQNTGESILRKNYGSYNVVLPVEKLNQFDFADHIGTCNFWLATYKTSLLQGFYPLFMEHVRYDDNMLFTLPLVTAKTYIVYDFPVYNYLLGRDGQSVDEAQVRLHLNERIKTYKYAFQKTVSTCGKDRIPHTVLHSFTGQVTLLMGLCSQYSYKQCRLIKSFVPDYAPVNFDEFENSKIYRRYKAMPLILFYLMQRTRLILNKLRK